MFVIEVILQLDFLREFHILFFLGSSRSHLFFMKRCDETDGTLFTMHSKYEYNTIVWIHGTKKYACYSRVLLSIYYS